MIGWRWDGSRAEKSDAGDEWRGLGNPSRWIWFLLGFWGYDLGMVGILAIYGNRAIIGFGMFVY